MNISLPNMVFIGHEKVGTALHNIMEDCWNVSHKFDNVEEFTKAVRDGAVEQLDGVLIMDHGVFDTTGTDTSFETLIASMAPQCFVAVINYQTDIQLEIVERINAQRETQGTEQSRNYLINPNHPRVTLLETFEHYQKNVSRTHETPLLSKAQRT